MANLKIEQRPGKASGAKDTGWPMAHQSQHIHASAFTDAIDIARANSSDSLIVIHNGTLVVEAYWNDKTRADVQQTFSGTKSLYSLLVGRCIQRGYLEGLDQPVHSLVAELPVHLRQLTFRNVLSMASGMECSPTIEMLGQSGMTQLEIALERSRSHPPMTHYHYNNAAYRLTFTALERASNRSIEELTHEEVFEPLEFANAHWMRIYAVTDIATDERFTGYQSVRMRPLDFAKSAQIIVDQGRWNGSTYLEADYVASLVTAHAPRANPSFGLFHHLNRGSYFRDFAEPRKIERKLIPGAPDDAFLMFGSGGQVVLGIPSLSAAAVRTGGNAGSIYEADNYIARLFEQVATACS